MLLSGHAFRRCDSARKVLWTTLDNLQVNLKYSVGAKCSCLAFFTGAFYCVSYPTTLELIRHFTKLRR